MIGEPQAATSFYGLVPPIAERSSVGTNLTSLGLWYDIDQERQRQEKAAADEVKKANIAKEAEQKLDRMFSLLSVTFIIIWVRQGCCWQRCQTCATLALDSLDVNSVFICLWSCCRHLYEGLMGWLAYDRLRFFVKLLMLGVMHYDCLRPQEGYTRDDQLTYRTMLNLTAKAMTPILTTETPFGICTLYFLLLQLLCEWVIDFERWGPDQS